jgi:hypothetical protein
MGALELAGLVDEWWYARRLDMADEAGVLDGSRVLGCTQMRSHVPFPPQGGSVPLPCGNVARRFSPPDAGPAA